MGKENEKEMNFYEKLEEYFKNTPREKVLKDWEETKFIDDPFSDINELDFILAQLEDVLHGEEGNLVSKARKLVSKIRKEI